MSSTSLAQIGPWAVSALLGMGGLAAATDERVAEALPVAAITAGNAGAVVTLRVKVPDERLTRQGSGFLVDPSGTIVTALHLIDHAEQVLVRTPNGKRFRKVVVRAYDIGSDLAVLQIEGEGLTSAHHRYTHKCD